jgi:hypothetical protein
MPATIKHPKGHQFPAPPPNPPPAPGAETLYERLGGRPGVSRLIKWFYARVRFEPALEPIFNAHITKWGEHLETLVDFWCTQVGGPCDVPNRNGTPFQVSTRSRSLRYVAQSLGSELP